MIYLAVFSSDQPINLLRIYAIKPDVLKAHIDAKLDKTRDQISHIGFPESWAKANGTLVLPVGDGQVEAANVAE